MHIKPSIVSPTALPPSPRMVTSPDLAATHQNTLCDDVRIRHDPAIPKSLAAGAFKRFQQVNRSCSKLLVTGQPA